jgi:chaperone required for assembly of F1-ATPase
MENELWDPLVQWFEQRHGVVLPTTTTLVNPIPAPTLAAARARCMALNEWEVVGFDFAVQVRAPRGLISI